jgi:hypothetical protein
VSFRTTVLCFPEDREYENIRRREREKTKEEWMAVETQGIQIDINCLSE